MQRFKPFTLNIRGKLIEYAQPALMGILNITPDSFYGDSRTMERDDIDARVEKLIKDGADIIDIGGYSSRPGADEVSADEELRRLEMGIEAVRRRSVDIPVSVDTFRAKVAAKAVTSLGADIINDISGGELDDEMIDIVASTHAPYVMMHMRGNPATMQQYTDYVDVTTDVVEWLARRLAKFTLAGAGDIIIDPGFGFSKTLRQNFELLERLGEFEILGRPILVGISRKSMIYRTLDGAPETSLNGTTVLNTLALERGASILRVHDVAPAREAIKLVLALKN